MNSFRFFNKPLIAFATSLTAPLVGICQTPPPPGGGFNPDQPLNGVPIDPQLTVVFVALSVGFAVLAYKKLMRRKKLA